MGSPSLKSKELRHSLAKNVRAMLETLQWSENELARRSAVSQKQINNVTQTRTGCGIDALDAIARAMAVEPWQLLQSDFHRFTDIAARHARVVRTFKDLPEEARAEIERALFAATKKSSSSVSAIRPKPV